VVVQQGSLIVYDSMGSHCHSMTYTAGQSFIERPGEVMNVLNTGAGPYTLFVTFPRVPHGELARTDEPDPGTCPGI
jgi:quercetin dioxygenase-like cupin family protein